VLGPHHREDSQLGQVRLASHERDDAFVLIGLQTVAFENGGVNHRCKARLSAERNAQTMESKITQPSTPPSSASQARSGCGIMPTTLRAPLQSAAIALTDPFGFHASSTRPCGSV